MSLHRPSPDRGLLALLITLTSLTAIQPALALGTRDAAALAAMKAFAGSETGVVVWQSRRTGPAAHLRLRSRRRQPAPALPRRLRQGSHRAADLPRRRGCSTTRRPPWATASYYNDHIGEMMIVDASDTKGSAAGAGQGGADLLRVPLRPLDRQTTPSPTSARTTTATRYSLSAKARAPSCSTTRSSTFGAIPNKQLTYAIDGFNRVFALKSGSATQQQDFDGCEGNMTNDGLWAYRVKASSHDFARMKLGSWGEETFFDNHDAAPCPPARTTSTSPSSAPASGTWPWGPRPTQHDHFNSDYDIFVVPIDPRRPTRRPDTAVKYSFDSKLDAYPDIWVAPDVQSRR